MVQIFEQGGVKGWDLEFEKDLQAKVKRKNDAMEIMKMICLTTIEAYGVVIGPHGVGKSTLIHQCIRKMEEPKEIVYFLIETKDVEKTNGF
jgi:GTPase SAR1 family protein